MRINDCIYLYVNTGKLLQYTSVGIVYMHKKYFFQLTGLKNSIFFLNLDYRNVTRAFVADS